tara:strand:- start:106 stop:516 length:411 start_codon:yes stop_codon:yes gene_type:complete
LTKKVGFILFLRQGDFMKQNIAYDYAKFEQANLLDEVCTIYPDLLEVRKKLPNIYKDFEKMYQEMCQKVDSECISFEDTCHTINMIFRVHRSGIDFTKKRKGNIFFLKLSDKTVDRLMYEVEQFKLWVDCILRTQP